MLTTFANQFFIENWVPTPSVIIEKNWRIKKKFSDYFLYHWKSFINHFHKISFTPVTTAHGLSLGTVLSSLKCVWLCTPSQGWCPPVAPHTQTARSETQNGPNPKGKVAAGPGTHSLLRIPTFKNLLECKPNTQCHGPQQPAKQTALQRLQTALGSTDPPSRQLLYSPDVHGRGTHLEAHSFRAVL